MKSRNIPLRRLVAPASCLALFGISFLLAGRPPNQETAKPADLVFEARKGGHVARLTVCPRPFHKNTYQIVQKEGGFLVDGRIALGTDSGLPKVEIERMTLLFDGKAVAIPATLYRDVFEPCFKEGSFAIRFGDDPDSLFVFMSGGDAAGSYQLLWVFRRDGRHSRFSLPCPDCRFIDFLGGGLDEAAEEG